MKRLEFVVTLAFAGTALACGDGMMSPLAPSGTDMAAPAVFDTNGETIFRTGRNLQAVIVQDVARSQMPMPHSCVSCHGSAGTGSMMGGMMGSRIPSIRFRDLADPRLHPRPYTEERSCGFSMTK